MLFAFFVLSCPEAVPYASRRGVGRSSANSRRNGVFQQRIIAEQQGLFRPGGNCLPGLLDAGPRRRAAGIGPSATATATDARVNRAAEVDVEYGVDVARRSG